MEGISISSILFLGNPENTTFKTNAIHAACYGGYRPEMTLGMNTLLSNPIRCYDYYTGSRLRAHTCHVHFIEPLHFDVRFTCQSEVIFMM